MSRNKDVVFVGLLANHTRISNIQRRLNAPVPVYQNNQIWAV